MKYILFILFFPLCVSAQKIDTIGSVAIGGGNCCHANMVIDAITQRLRQATDSFMFYRCKAKCLEPQAGGFYINKREHFRELAQQNYNLFDAQRKKTNVRFRNPDHYLACPCQAPDTVLEHYRDSLDYYREEWEFSGRKNQTYQQKMFYFSHKISDRGWNNYINKAKNP